MDDQPLKSTLEMTALLADYLRNTISDADRIRLEQWLAAHENDRKALEELIDEDKVAEHWQSLDYYRERTERARMKVAMAMERKRGVIRPIAFFRAVAAAILLLIAAGAGIWMFKSKPATPAAEFVADVLPGTEKAQLVMGNGQSITLGNTNDTAFIQGAAVKVTSDQGLLTYEGVGDNGETQYHQLITPKGGQYHLKLSDGTDVWLNAASSIRFPTHFEGERIVQITGEAYFEVAPDAQNAFIVEIEDKSKIHVLGTRFNVNAYKDEERINTTLLQGSVRVWHYTAPYTGKSIRLKPGEQTVIGRHQNDSMFMIPADTARAVAWKNGIFDFNDAKLADVMRQVSRWYDIDIVYEKGIPDIKVWGKMKRNQNLQQLITILNGMDLKVRLEKGNRLIVLQ